MVIKRDILWRVYLVFLGLVVLCCFVLYKAFKIQQIEGKYWVSMGDSLHQKIVHIPADRGTIYSNTGDLLSTSMSHYNLYIDFMAPAFIRDGGKLFKENIDSLSWYLHKIAPQHPTSWYHTALLNSFVKKYRYYKFLEHLDFKDVQVLRKAPMVRLGKNKSGFILEKYELRLNPFKNLAFRTIGLNRDSFNVGLEKKYNDVLQGVDGTSLVRYVAGGVPIPVGEFDQEPIDGHDIVTSLDIPTQEITEDALQDAMMQNKSESGCAIVMEVSTGKIIAMANLGKQKDGSYWEDYNYALQPSEPGSTFKVVSILSAFEDQKATPESLEDIEKGAWQINGATVFDSEKHNRRVVNVKQAFDLSSNVGMAKLIYNSYAKTPKQFINHIHDLALDTLTGVDLAGEGKPVVYAPGSKSWNGNVLPWMAFGYNVSISPLQIAMLYNAIANNGVMLRPYLVEAIVHDGAISQTFKPQIVRPKICSDRTLAQVKECLIGACNDPFATGYKVFKNCSYMVAGKTGTSLISNAQYQYKDKVYQSSFVGFFPALDPAYTIIVVIKNSPKSPKYYGADVAAPVFKKIADYLMPFSVSQSINTLPVYHATPTNNFLATQSIKTVLTQLDWYMQDSSRNSTLPFYDIHQQTDRMILYSYAMAQQMPQLTGMCLRDALSICELMGLKASVIGDGRVAQQSIPTGSVFKKGDIIKIKLL
ncbi:MAG: penicillin-binding protein [Phycisphaerales bacterium]|nr:penicillin-binding protein [Phycisphaerales bacterium]